MVQMVGRCARKGLGLLVVVVYATKKSVIDCEDEYILDIMNGDGDCVIQSVKSIWCE